MSKGKHARAVLSAELPVGINRPLPSLESNRDQAGLVGMTCEGPYGAKNMLHNTTQLS